MNKMNKFNLCGKKSKTQQRLDVVAQDRPYQVPALQAEKPEVTAEETDKIVTQMNKWIDTAEFFKRNFEDILERNDLFANLNCNFGDDVEDMTKRYIAMCDGFISHFKYCKENAEQVRDDLENRNMIEQRFFTMHNELKTYRTIQKGNEKLYWDKYQEKYCVKVGERPSSSELNRNRQKSIPMLYNMVPAEVFDKFVGEDSHEMTEIEHVPQEGAYGEALYEIEGPGYELPSSDQEDHQEGCTIGHGEREGEASIEYQSLEFSELSSGSDQFDVIDDHRRLNDSSCSQTVTDIGMLIFIIISLLAIYFISRWTRTSTDNKKSKEAILVPLERIVIQLD